MSIRSDVVNLLVNINGNEAQNQLNDLRKKAADITMEMGQLKKGTQEWADKKKDLNGLTKEMDNLKQTIGLTALSQKELQAELKKLNAMKGSVQPFTEEFHNLQTQIETVEARLYDVKNGVQGFSSFFSKISDQVKQFGVLAAGALGFQFITSQFQSIIQGGAKLSDQLADIRRITGMSAEEVAHLNKELSNINTRTSTEGLRNIAIVAGKLGVAKEDIIDFVKATDMLVVALGDELGDADQITTQLGKIINVFDKGDGKITGEKLSEVGNAIVDLANKGVASGPFIVDFSQRMAGLAKSANLSLPAVMGLAAGLEESGQKVESSSTAIIKVLSQIGTDVPKFAAIAGKSVEEFSKTLAEKPVEAIIQVSEGFTKGKNSFQEISKAFADAGEDGAKIVSTLGVVGNKADFFREKINNATEAIGKTNEITDAFNIKNATLGAVIEKTGKEFNKLMTSPAVSQFLDSAARNLLNFLLWLKDLPNWLERNRTAIIAITGVVLTYASSKITLTAATIANRLALLAENIQFAAQYTWLIIVDAATKAYAFAKGVLTGQINLATAATRIWNLVLKQNPIMWLVGGVTLLVTGISYLTSKVGQLTAAQKVQNELQQRTVELSSEEEAKAQMLFRTLQMGISNYDEKKKLLNELIAINPKYLSGLTAENITTLEGQKIMDGYIQKLREANAEKARQSLIMEKEKLLQEKKLKLQQINPDVASSVSTLGNIQDGLSILGIGKGSGLKQLRDASDEIKQINDELNALYKTSAAEINKKTSGSNSSKESPIDNSLKAEIERLETKKKQLEATRLALNKDDQKGNEANLKQQEEVQKRIDFLNGKKEKDENNKYAEMRKRFEELMDSLNVGIAKDTLSPMEAKFVEINNQLAKEIKLVNELKAKGGINSSEANNAMDLIRQKAIADIQKAASEQKEANAKKFKNADIQVPVLVRPDFSNIEKMVMPIKSKLAEYFKRDKKAELELNVLNTTEGTRAHLNAIIQQLESERQERLQQEGLTLKEIELLNKEYDDKVKKAKIDFYIELANKTVDVAKKVNGLLNAMEDRQLAKELAANDKKKLALKKQLDAKLISQEQYNLQVDKLDQESDKKKKKLAYDQAKRQKAIDLVDAISSTALAVAGFLSAKPVGPWNIPLAIAAGVMGAVQVATIAAQPLPELAKGQWVTNGDKHNAASGGIMAKIERGEAVMNANGMENPNTYTISGTPAQITSAINSQIGNGISWAPGAVFSKLPQINPQLPTIMAMGGVAYATQPAMQAATKSTDAQGSNPTTAIFQQLITEHQKTREMMNNWQNQLEVKFSIREYDKQKAYYDTAKKESNIKR